MIENNRKSNRFFRLIGQVFTPVETLCVLLALASLYFIPNALTWWNTHSVIGGGVIFQNVDEKISQVNPTKDNKKLTLKVAAPLRERVLSRLSPYGPGLEHELLTTFADQYDIEVRYQQASSRSEALRMLREGEVQLVLGFAGDLTYDDGQGLVAGSSYVLSASGNVVNNDDAEGRHYGRASKVLFSMARHIDQKNDLAEGFSPEDWSTLNQGPFIEEDSEVLDEYSFKLWQPFRPGLKVSFKNVGPATYRWVWRADDADFFPLFQCFWNDLAKNEHIQELEEKYFGFLPSGSPPWENLQDLAKAVHSNVPGYNDVLNAASNRHNVNPLLLVALIYQESRFDPEAKSYTGALGLMQFTQATARRMNVDPRDPIKSIDAGAKYLKILWDSLGDLELDYWNRWFFTLAAYNQGMGHLRDAVRLSRQQGGTGRTWLELKKIYPLLTQEKYHSKTKYGYCRGQEAVAFVERVRYYFYVLNGLTSISRFEGQDLAAR